MPIFQMLATGPVNGPGNGNKETDLSILRQKLGLRRVLMCSPTGRI